MEKLFYESSETTVKKFQTLGTGGFGSVHSGILEHKVRILNEYQKISVAGPCLVSRAVVQWL